MRQSVAPLVLPRIGTPRTRSRPTLGPHLVAVMGELGFDPHAWQSYAADVSMQLVRRRRGRVTALRRERVSPWRLQARNVTVEVGRQSGKTALAEARAWTQCLLPSLDGVAEIVGGQVGPQRVGWLAQDRASALRAWAEAVDRLMWSPYAELVDGKPRLQRGDEQVRFVNGSLVRVVTPSRTGPRGLALDLIVLDEALAHDVELLAALAPTQAQRDGHIGSIGAQLVALSSAPEDEARSSLLVALREQGRRAVAEGDPTKCWLEWSAEPGCDPYDEAQWAIAVPTLDRPGGVSSDFLRLQAETLDRDTFSVEYLSLPSLGPATHCIDVDAWAMAPQVDFRDDITLAVDGRLDAAGAAIVAVGRSGDVIGVEVLEQADDVEWVPRRVAELAARWSAPVVVDRSGPMAWLIARLQRAELTVVTANLPDVMAAAAGFAVAVSDGVIGHDRDPRLDEAVEAAVRRRSGDRWAFDRTCPIDLSALIAASLGVWALQSDRVVVPRVF